jgi:hypothetical protein
VATGDEGDSDQAFAGQIGTVADLESGKLIVTLVVEASESPTGRALVVVTRLDPTEALIVQHQYQREIAKLLS